jgi:protein-S-isoprenylcysteine O-methyltransferase Ste14
MTRKRIGQIVAGIVVGILVTLIKLATGDRSSIFDMDFRHLDFNVESQRLVFSLALWIAFFVYWGIASRNQAPTKQSESWGSTYFHQSVLGASLLLLYLQIPGLTSWYIPQRFHLAVWIGAIVQALSLLLAVWARRHLGRNWAAEVRIGVDHELVRTGPYRWVRHPIYTAMLGMFLGTAIASSQYHALLGVALLFVAYIRKTRLEEEILSRVFPTDYEAYRRSTWRLVPPVF